MPPSAWALLLGALLSVRPAAGAPIPPHPDKLVFKPFTYVPPHGRAHRVVLPRSQVAAYLAVDRELPLVTVQVYVRTGAYNEPAGKEGLAGLTGHLMARGGVEGKRPYTAEALEERLAFLAAILNSSIGATQGEVSLNLLSKDLDEGLGILRDVLSAPRFAESKIALRKDQILSDMKQRNDDARSIEARERSILSYGLDHFTNRFETKASIDAITRTDMIAFHRRWFGPANFIVAAAGDFDRDAMVEKLDALFSNWPYKVEPAAGAIPAPRERPQPGLYLIDKQDVTQGRVSILLPGYKRDDPDAFAIQVMNEILGGGGFTSRITNRVRSDEGLAYQAASRFDGGVYYPGVFLALFQSKLRTCGYATQVVLEEIRRIADKGVTKEELATAKKHFIETLPQLFRTKIQAMDVLASEEFTGRYQRDPDYYQRYEERIQNVSAEDVARVARKWLDPQKAAILMIGKKADLMNPDPKHPVALSALASGRITELPLRDPLTMLPMKSPQRPPPAK